MTSAEVGDRPAAQRKAAAAAVRAFANVWFTCEDFASSAHTPQSLDTIMCLSVTKWVHLNQGDEGLKRLFVKVKESLVPGGWFVLEPQPWRSYQQARRKQVSQAQQCCLSLPNWYMTALAMLTSMCGALICSQEQLDLGSTGRTVCIFDVLCQGVLTGRHQVSWFDQLADCLGLTARTETCIDQQGCLKSVNPQV